MAYENVTIIVWHAPPDPAAVERLRHVSERRRKQYPNGISAVHFIKGQFELPSAPTRDAFVRLVREGEGTLNVLAVIVSGAGFWASAVRSLITSFRVLSRGNFDLGFYASVEELMKLLPEKHRVRTGVTLAPEALARALRRADAFEQPEDPFKMSL
jgi:hypothetical protein